jgi:hypothetical protein
VKVRTSCSGRKRAENALSANHSHCWGLITVGQARVLVVHVVAGDELFARSGWLRRALPTGTAGWLVPTAYYSPWDQPHWRPSVSLLDDQSRRTGRIGGMVRFISLVPDAGMAFACALRLRRYPPHGCATCSKRAGSMCSSVRWNGHSIMPDTALSSRQSDFFSGLGSRLTAVGVSRSVQPSVRRLRDGDRRIGGAT